MPARAAHQGGSVQYEDTLGVDGDAGVSILGFRNDADAVMSTADLSHSRVSVDDVGRMKVAVGVVDQGASYVDAATTDVHEPAANTAATRTLAAGGAGVRHFITGVAWSYDGVPTAGSLTITDGGATVFKVDITAAGPGFFDWDPAMRCAPNSAVVGTLAAGGAGISGIFQWKGKFTV